MAGILIVLVTFVIYLIERFASGSVDKNLLMCIKAFLFGVYCLAYSTRIANANTAWIYKWSGSKIDKSTIHKAIKYFGTFSLVVGIILILFNKFWFSPQIIVWGIFYFFVLKLLFDFISRADFSSRANNAIATFRKFLVRDLKKFLSAFRGGFLEK